MKKLIQQLDLQDLHLPKQVPFTLTAAALIAISASWVLISLPVLARTTNSKAPRVHLFQDMDHQPKYKAQSPSAVFADGRSNRQPVTGTVARGMLFTDDHLHYGFELTEDLEPVLNAEGLNNYYEGLPEALQGDADHIRTMIERGQVLYNTYCYTCHGMDGQGAGPTHIRASQLQSQPETGTSWVAPANIVGVTEILDTDADGNVVLDENEEPVVLDSYTTYTADRYPDGQLFDVIRNGKGNMAGYRAQLDAEEAWAVVLYVRSLQAAQSPSDSE